MDVLEAIRKRRAVHAFLPGRELDDEQLRILIESAALSPSGYNIQPWEFVVIKDDARKEELKEIAFNQEHVADASLAIVVLGDIGFPKRARATVDQWLEFGYLNESQGNAMMGSLTKERSNDQLREMAMRNVGLVTMSILLAAEGLGLATCPMMGFSKWKMDKFLNLPEDKFAGMLIVVGYEDKSVVNKPRLPRRSFEELVSWETYGNKKAN